MFNAKAAAANEAPETLPVEPIKAPSPEIHTKRRVIVLSEIISPYRIPVFNALAKCDGIDLHVVFLAETDPALRQWRVYKDEIDFSYTILPSRRLRAGKYNLLLNFGLRSFLQKFSPQVIICGGYNYVASWRALSWAKHRRIEFILWSESSSNDTRAGRPWVEALKKRFLNRCDGFVVPGKAAQRYLQSFGLIHNILIAPNAVDNSWFQSCGESIRAREAEFREKFQLPSRFVLFVGRLVPEKGVFDLLDAYIKLEDHVRSRVGLVFAGDGVSRSELERKARQVNPGVINFPGFLHREELAGLYALAEAMVLPTHSDTWGLVVNEAMACALPIIVTSAAGCSADLVEDGWNGYVVPLRDSERLSKALDSLLRSSGLRQEMSWRSAERIRQYSPETCAKGLAAAVFSIQRRIA